MIKFNVNDMVLVKLTDFGRECLKKDWEKEFWGDLAFSPIEEDEYGRSGWRLWNLMAVFGAHLAINFTKQPFEAEIEILND